MFRNLNLNRSERIPNEVKETIATHVKSENFTSENFKVTCHTYNLSFETEVITCLNSRFVLMSRDRDRMETLTNTMIDLNLKKINWFNKGQQRQVDMPGNWVSFGRAADLRYVDFKKYTGEDIRNTKLQHPQKIFFSGTYAKARNATNNLFPQALMIPPYSYGNVGNLNNESLGSTTYPCHDQMLMMMYADEEQRSYELLHLDANNEILLPLLRIHNSEAVASNQLDLSPNAEFLTCISYPKNGENRKLCLFDLKPVYEAKESKINFAPIKKLELKNNLHMTRSTKPYHWVSSTKLVYVDSERKLQSYNPYTQELNCVINNVDAFNFLTDGKIFIYSHAHHQIHQFSFYSRDEYNCEYFFNLQKELINADYHTLPNTLVNMVIDYVVDPRLFALRKLPLTLSDHQASLSRRINLCEKNLKEENNETEDPSNDYYVAMRDKLKRELEIVSDLVKQVKNYNQSEKNTSGATLTYQDCVRSTLDKFPDAIEFVSIHKYLQQENYQPQHNFKI